MVADGIWMVIVPIYGIEHSSPYMVHYWLLMVTNHFLIGTYKNKIQCLVKNGSASNPQANLLTNRGFASAQKAHVWTKCINLELKLLVP